MNWFHKHYKFVTLPRGAILDIGSGSNPFWRANILMERFLEDDSQRPGRLIVDRPIVCGDIHQIPFVDNAFSFVHCSHLLEHVDDPDMAIREMSRVARCGYIETPSEIHEFIDLDFPFHRWAVSSEEGILVFREKSQYIPSHPLIVALKSKGNRTSRLIGKHHSQINIISSFWNGEVEYRVERSKSPIEYYTKTHDEPFSSINYAVRPAKAKLKLILGKILSPPMNLYSILACPICKHHIAVDNSSVICTKCNKKFPIRNRVPMMMEEYASCG
jgi:uncharacterized protein YbaR (Trm112 family)/SAM-dependent methyltransferase